jgi:hypothetical protein
VSEGRAAPGDGAAPRRGPVALALGAAGALALGLRALGLERVFSSDGRILLALHDCCYHARRALYSFEHFPAVLELDPFIAFPGGAVVPMPPLYDWALAGVALLFGTEPDVFELVAAWTSPVLSALCVLPVYAIGRGVAGRGVGIGAAFLYALLPASATFALAGNCDHHAAVALLGALWLASSVWEAERGPRAGHVLLHAAIVAAMLFTWSGSLLYLALGEGARLAVGGVIAGGPRRLLAQAAGCALAAAPAAAWVARAPTPVGGAFSSTTLSWLHVVALAGLAALCAAAGYLELRAPARGPARRALRLAGLGAALALPALALPELRAALAVGGGFVAGQDTWAGANPEQQPLFAGADGRLSAARLFGHFAWLLPLLPVFLALRLARAPSGPLWLLFFWTSTLGGLALAQMRFASDFAAPAAVALALALAAVREPLARRLPAPAAGAALAGAALLALAPALRGYAATLAVTLRHYGDAAPASRLHAEKLALIGFAERVRGATPEPGDFLSPHARPEWGLLANAPLGHSLLWYARRPLPANNFGPYLDPARFADVTAFFSAEREADALAIAERLRARFVATASSAGLVPPRVAYQLHLADGSALDGRPHLGRFRLVLEGAGPPPSFLDPPPALAHAPAYKLFERVAGALLEVPSAGGAPVTAELELESELGRAFRFSARAAPDADGVARLRLPYPSDGSGRTRSRGPWRVQRGGERAEIVVGEAAVLRGDAIRVLPAAPGPAQIPRR